MQRNRSDPDGRLSSRAGRLAAVLVLTLMSVVASRLEAQWVPFSPPDSVPDRASHATVYDPVNDRIYMFGGTPTGASGSEANLCQRYDPVADTWTTMAAMLTARRWMSAAYVRGKAYVVGGDSSIGDALAVNEEYTIAADSWTSRRPLPLAVLAHMTGVWRDSLIYVMGGLKANYNAVETVQVYDPFTDSWAIGTPMLRPGDMSGPAVIVGDTIYISDAYDRSVGQVWGRMLKGAINPDTPNQITWLWGPRLPEGMGSAKGTVSLHNKVYAFGLTYPESTVVMTGCVYDPATGGYTESLPGLLLEGISGFYGEIVVAREAASEVYQVAGSWTSPSGGSRYHRLQLSPQGVGEAGPTVMPPSRLRVSTLFRNGARIHYEVDRPCRATLTVYDQSGRVVRTLVSGQMRAGSYTGAWDGRDEYGRATGSGVYFCRLQAGEFTTARKMVKAE